MCGIAGTLYGNGRVADSALLTAMAQRIAHRGPDGFGVQTLGRAGFAHRRLKIIDLSEAGRQPMSNEDGTVWVTFNGEIYNFQGLRNELQGKGHSFRSRTDTEVIVHLYEEQGLDGLARLDGMFAFALWDGKTERLVLGRDRTGKKPLYIYEDDQKLVFGSEIKAILAHPDIDRRMWDGAVPQYLTFGYVPTPRTFYERITKLPPASFYVVERDGRRSTQTFWDFPIRDANQPGEPSEREATARIRELFRAAVSRRLMSDVPLGAFLSGGVDSTLVVGMMSELMKEPVRTFSIGFEGDAAYDETQFAKQAATRFGTNHTEFRVDPKSFDLIRGVVEQHDEPYGDSSSIPTTIVSQLTREHVTVALTGDGGDEVFAGYERFYAAVLSERIPRPLGRSLNVVARAMPGGGNYKSVVNKARRFLSRFDEELPERFRSWISIFRREDLANLLRVPPTEDALGDSFRGCLENAARADLTNQLLYLNAKTYLLDDLNAKVDRASMSVSLETRSPFLDTELMEYAFRLPGHLKLHGKSLKWILKRAFPDLLPTEISQRGKMGFGVPLGAWFRTELRTYVEQLLLPSTAKIHEFVRPESVAALLKEHQERRRDWGLPIWSLLTLELWLQGRGTGRY